MDQDDPANEPSQSPGEIWKRHRIPIVLGLVSVILIIISLVLLVKSVQTTSPIQFSSAHEMVSTPSGQASVLITIDIEGAITKPGVYQLPSASRVSEAVKLAGGLTAEADTELIAKTINLATKLVDGGKLYIPKKGESLPANIVRHGDTMGAGSSTQGFMISINSASQAQLESLPGVGPVTAGKIISNRPYQTLVELITKKAISQSLFDKIKGSLSL